MALLETLKSLVNERLSAASEEIFGTIGQILTEFEDEALSLKQDIYHKSKLLDMVLKLYINRADILHLPLFKEGVYPEQQNMNSSPVLEEPPIKEEQEELLLRLDQGSTLLVVKREDDAENREKEPVAITSADLMKTQTNVEECSTQPTSDSHRSESDTEESEEWEETEGFQTANMEGNRLSLSKNLIQDVKSPKQAKCQTGKNVFNCTVCGKCFMYPSDLKRHMMTHTGERPFTCKVCGKGFSKTSTLKTHMMTHTGEKPYSCTVCGKGCIYKSRLKTHMMTHTGEKPFTCTVCGKGYSSRANLKTHLRNHMEGEREHMEI